MCNKMTRLFDRFVGEMGQQDALLRACQSVLSTVCFKVGPDRMPRDYVSISPAQECPPDRMVSLMCGSRASNYDNHIVTLTGAEYNSIIKNRGGTTTAGRYLNWRNYLIDNKKVWKAIDMMIRQMRSHNLDSSYLAPEAKLIEYATHYEGRKAA